MNGGHKQYFKNANDVDQQEVLTALKLVQVDAFVDIFPRAIEIQKKESLTTKTMSPKWTSWTRCSTKSNLNLLT
ncbi:hypothetical protein HX448_02940 [Dehalogenimonas etheniformans]|uniref:DNA mimic protein DMP19 C-terminal domain-containing protein n=2 Tax=Dehalogenimonas etheniformans TaxID=1536648 RepID=A0A2P5P7P7_9CHLR|nr:hypothetical protein JP09_005830 [Dehalogenimonas etheniformans]QNT75719.1 hypothetical protein HX448_02940 [Dehalogenimonas etheniformans]